MKVGTPIISTRADGRCSYSAVVETSDCARSLEYSVSDASLVSESSDAALVALLIPAMVIGQDMHLDGHVSPKLLYNVNGPLQAVLTHVMPRLNRIKVTCSSQVAKLNRAEGVATGFSGGIDSYCALADHYFADVPSGYRLTHLLFNDVGAHGRKAENFSIHFAKMRLHAQRIGLPLVDVRSNLQDFYQDFEFQQTHTLRNASVALLLQHGIGRFLYASAYSILDIDLRECKDTARSDLVTLPMLSTEVLDCLSVGSEYTRIEKTMKVTELADSYSSLDVCTSIRNNELNCSICSKCLRTMFSLELAGKLDLYKDVFDHAAYRKVSAGYAVRVLLHPEDAFEREIRDFAERVGFKPTLAAQLRYRLGRIPRRMHI